MAEVYPDLFHFIVARKEAYGGFLFNPYLYNEIFLDEKSFRILELCTGNLTPAEISGHIALEFGAGNAEAVEAVNQSLNEFNSYFAINWRNTRNPVAPPYKKPENPDFSGVRDFFINYYSAPNSVIFEVTRQCNLNCPHCLVSAGKGLSSELTFEEIKSILDQLREMKVFVVNFGGGEPFMRKDFIDILKYSSSINLGILISTNGYFIDEEILNELEQVNAFAVQISVDGLRETHDTFRGREGSFERALDALKKFSGRGYHTTMSTMIMKDNLKEMSSLLDLCLENKVASFKLSSFMPAGRGKKNAVEHALTKSEMKDFAEFMQMKKTELGDRLQIDDKATYNIIPETSDIRQDPGIKPVQYNIGCSAARTTLDIGPDGTVYPCPFLTHLPSGNLKEENLRDIWNNSPHFRIFRNLVNTDLKGKCRSCRFIPGECQGGCRAAAYLHSGDIYAEDPLCWIKDNVG